MLSAPVFPVWSVPINWRRPRLGSEYIELLPHHIRKSDRALISLLKDLGLSDELQWYDSLWYGKASKKKLGYLDNGFHSLLSALVQEITDRGGIIQYGYTVSDILRNEDPERPRYRVQCVLADSSSIFLECDTILYTGSCRNLVHITHALDMPTDRLPRLPDGCNLSGKHVSSDADEDTFHGVLFQTIPE